jgi:predicted AAA+ superfamily ATPase
MIYLINHTFKVSMLQRSFNPLKLLDQMASVLLLGPRGTGKTALIATAFAGVANQLRIDLLQGLEYQRYLNTPHKLGQELRSLLHSTKGEVFVSIDEIQRVPSLLNEVHSVIEEFRGRVAFLLTGSSARKLRRSGANLLAGRAISCFLHPLHASELELDLTKSLRIGTLPGVYLGREELAIPTLESYVSTYLREEIQQESLVREIDRFSRFLEYAGQNNGEPINFTKLGKQSGIAGKTAQEYFSILVDTLVAHCLPGWSESVKKQLLQAPKFYFFDTGVLNAINGYLRVDLRESSFLYGRLFEAFIISQLIATNDYLSLGYRFFYWRDKNGREVDLIIARNVSTPLAAVEIKSSTSPTADDCSGFIAFQEDYPHVPRICVCNAPYTYTDQGISFIPWGEFVLGSYLTALL